MANSCNTKRTSVNESTIILTYIDLNLTLFHFFNDSQKKLTRNFNIKKMKIILSYAYIDKFETKIALISFVNKLKSCIYFNMINLFINLKLCYKWSIT